VNATQCTGDANGALFGKWTAYLLADSSHLLRKLSSSRLLKKEERTCSSR
jgi:hypothetical protein